MGSLCTAATLAARRKQAHLYQQAHGYATPALRSWHEATVDPWAHAGEPAIRAEMERRVLAAYPLPVVVPPVPKVDPWPAHEATILAAWLLLPAPRTIDHLATVLGTQQRPLQGLLYRHQLGSVKRLDAALAKAAIT